jgi:hypothetical protein
MQNRILIAEGSLPTVKTTVMQNLTTGSDHH